MLLEHIQQHSEVPAGTNVDNAKQLREHLFNQLLIMLTTTFEWYAMCTVAVDAGNRIAWKKQAKRLRVKGLIDILSEYIGDKSPCYDFPYGWETVNMTHGYMTGKQAAGAALAYAMFKENIRRGGECDVLFTGIIEKNKLYEPGGYDKAKTLATERRITIEEAYIRLNISSKWYK